MIEQNARPIDQMFQRVIMIVNLLMSAPRGLSVAHIAAEVGAAPSVVRDDLYRLAEYARAPLTVSGDAELDGESDDARDYASDEIWSLASKDFAFPVTGLSPREARTLLDILERIEGEGAGGLCQRLDASLSSAGVRRRVLKAGRTIYGEGQEESKIDALGAYVAERASMTVIYTDRHNRSTQRDICPVALVYDWRTCAWYLYGHNGRASAGNGFRHFRVSRIESFRPALKHVEAPDDSSVDQHVKSCWGVECSLAPVKVAVRFADDYNVLDRLYADTTDRENAQYEKQTDGSVIYRDIMPGWNEFRAWVATFGESAEVLEPPQLRRSMALAVQRVLDRYAQLGDGS